MHCQHLEEEQVLCMKFTSGEIPDEILFNEVVCGYFKKKEQGNGKKKPKMENRRPSKSKTGR